ncbi:hypothetical protein BN873_230021 [Candidatus Competibacter denitrificans Run_A_D11]|uniref:Phasin domain-containing protein n=1 Tax=Candidatus Competibacter denitrificans Run_A_D11 TaxID=1400863 RepID=W6M350_9GAMM|nr:phasin family protein [Candidatus Competibacter denitrificans]CDI02006.1 hypothetical protein BN873_230021 [Candidatus Competibacter denitrificans Run_A_D11]HAS86057.1 hypothetical protein [Candidatus Competibacteraceae bacterium]
MNDMPVPFFEPMRPAIASLAKTNQVVIGQWEKWLTLGMSSFKAYVDLGLAQAKVALKVTDPRSAHEFSDSQFAVLSFVGHQMMDDGRALAEWGVDCCCQANRLGRENALRILFKD